MHLLVPHAASGSAALGPALRDLVLPQLTALLSLLTETARDTADEMTLTPPHERAIAVAAGLQLPDGQWPQAALDAALAGIDPGTAAWGRLTPTHWNAGATHVTLVDPAELALDEATSRAFLDAVRELFETEGFTLHYAAPTCWLATHAAFDGLPCASLDRVIGRNIDAWLPADPRARLLRRLQNEVQMLLYRHPLNAEREAAGALPVNSFWLSGCGKARLTAWPDGLQIDERLRAPALAGDAFAWSRAWQALDAGPLTELLARARRGDPVALTLCGERAAVQLALRPRGLLQRVASAMRKPDVPALLESL
jgi:hypothetical protein